MAKKIFVQDPEKFIAELAKALKEIPEFVVPEWAAYVKSGTSKKRPPVAEDFWFTRAASILRQLYVRGVVGVGRLRNRYGSRKDRGGKPDEFRKAGGKIIRVILQQAEAAGIVERMTNLQYGRRLTEKGRELLDSIETEQKAELSIDDITVNTLPMQEVAQEDEEADEIEELNDEAEEITSEEDEE